MYQTPLGRKHNRCCPPLHGFTLVELLVVITIIGMLIALLLPAVQAAREAARRMQCGNNFKQVGLAMHGYHNARECFPPGIIYTRPTDPPVCGGQRSSVTFAGWSFGAYILPYMEQSAIYDRIKWDYYFSGSLTSGNNLLNYTARVPAYSCPTDPQAGELIDVLGIPGELGCRQTNMAPVADSQQWWCVVIGYFRQFSAADGMCANLQGCRIRDVKDGTSNTLMIGEVTGEGPGTRKGFFWMSWDIADTSEGINGNSTVPGGGSWPRLWSLPGFSSFHPGGCNFVLGDGSVSFISQNIRQDVLAALTTRNGRRDGLPEPLISGPP